MEIIAMIPAREGSKGIPSKNRLLLAGKPMMAHTIEAARKCRAIDEVFVNSESDEFLTIGREFGAQSHKRPEILAEDTASMKSVLSEFVEEKKRIFRQFAVVVLYPTYPLRSAEDIARIIKEYRKKKECPLVGLKEPKTHPYLVFDANKLPIFRYSFNKLYRRQDYPIYYELTHFACVVPCSAIREINNQLLHNNLKKQRYITLHQEKERLVNVDTREDFEQALNSFKTKRGFCEKNI